MIDEMIDAFRGAVREVFPSWGYSGIWEYTVFSAGSTYDLRPTDASLPPISSASFKPGIPGLTSLMQVGALVYVQFVNCDPARPVVVAVAGPGDAGFTPTSIAIVASGSARLDGSSIALGTPGPNLAPPVRYGDTVAITGSGAAAGVIGLTTPFGIPPTPTKVLA